MALYGWSQWRSKESPLTVGSWHVTNHLKALAKVSRILRNRSTCEKLRSTLDKSALYSILTTDQEIQAA